MSLVLIFFHWRERDYIRSKQFHVVINAVKEAIQGNLLCYCHPSDEMDRQSLCEQNGSGAEWCRGARHAEMGCDSKCTGPEADQALCVQTGGGRGGSTARELWKGGARERPGGHQIGRAPRRLSTAGPRVIGEQEEI